MSLPHPFEHVPPKHCTPPRRLTGRRLNFAKQPKAQLLVSTGLEMYTLWNQDVASGPLTGIN